MNGWQGAQRKLCAFKGCERYPTETVHLHDGVVPTIVGTCLEHEFGLLESDRCDFLGCERRAVQFRRCGVHPKPIDVRGLVGSMNRRAVTVSGGREEDDVSKKRTAGEAAVIEEAFVQKVLGVVKEKGSIRFGDVAIELETKDLKRITAALHTLKSRGDLVQTGVPKTPTSRWAMVGFVPPAVEAAAPKAKTPKIPKAAPAVTDAAVGTAGELEMAPKKSKGPKSKAKSAEVLDRGVETHNVAPVEGGQPTCLVPVSELASSVSVAVPAASGPTVSAPVEPIVPPRSGVKGIVDRLQVLARFVKNALPRLPGDVAVGLCREVEDCYVEAGVSEALPWNPPAPRQMADGFV